MPSARQLPRAVAGGLRMVWAASRRDLLIALALQLVQGVGILGVLLAIRAVLAAVLDAQSLAGALPAVALLALLQVATGVVGAVLSERDQLLGEVVRQHVQGRVFTVAADLDYAAFETPAVYDRLERAAAGAGYGPVQLVQGLFALTGALAGVAGTTVALVVLQPLLVPVVLLAAVPIGIVAARVGAAMSGFVFELTPAERERGYLATLLTGRDAAKEVRTLGIGAHLLDRWSTLTAGRVASLRRVVRRQLRQTVAGSLLGTVALAAALTGLAAAITSGRVEPAEAGAAAAALLLLNQRLQSAGLALTMLFEGAPFVRDLADFLDAGRRQRESRAGAPAPAGFERVTVDRVGFRYPAADRPALRDVSLTLAAGQVVALVGENGSGKTTLATLLCGLHRPDSGRISWDDVDLATVDPAGLRSRVAVVFQDFVRFRLPARDNVAPGASGDLAAVRAAAARAGADGFLAALPAGYDTVLGPQFEGGVDLSGGQWQRVALARAFHRDAPLIILDEPTAALDPRAERALFDTVRTLASGRTVLLISHRYATVRAADLIVVLHDGEVVESGRHDELMARGGRYAELYTLQAAAYG